MQKNPLIDVFAVLKKLDVVASQSEFSRHWLGRSESYLRGLRFHNIAPNVAVVALCASRLQHYGEALSLTEKHEAAGALLLEQSGYCNDWIFEHSRSQWLPKKGFVAQNPRFAI